MDFDAARPVNLMTLKAETCSIDIDPCVNLILIVEHHGILHSIVQYLIKRGYENIIAFETGGAGTHNVRFTLHAIWEKYRGKRELNIILWSDMDHGGFNEYMGQAFGSQVNPVLNIFLVAPGIIHAGLRIVNLHDSHVNTAPSSSNNLRNIAAVRDGLRLSEHPDKMHMANDLQMIVDSKVKASLANVSINYIVEYSRAMVNEAFEQKVDLTLAPSDDGYEDKVKFLDFREGFIFAKAFDYDLEQFSDLPHQIINAFSKIVNEMGQYHPLPVRRITIENVRECNDPTDLQFCQLTDGQYVLLWLNDGTIHIFDPIKIQTPKDIAVFNKICEKRYASSATKIIHLDIKRLTEVKHSGIIVLAIAIQIINGNDPTALVPSFYTGHVAELNKIREIISKEVRN